MSSQTRNSIEFEVHGRYALFTDPLTRIGGEKCSYQLPTYEALKGIVKSIYWKPSLIWIVDEIRVMNRMQTQTKGTKPQEFGGGNTLAIYTFLKDVKYQVRAHFEWNEHRPELAADRVEGKHHTIANRMLERGGRQDIFLGTRDCQGYVVPCTFGTGQSVWESTGELSFGLMFHGFDYPDETGDPMLHSRFWHQKMTNGVVQFPRPEKCEIRKAIRNLTMKKFGVTQNLLSVDDEYLALEGIA